MSNEVEIALAKFTTEQLLQEICKRNTREALRVEDAEAQMWGARVKDARVDLKLSQTELAKALGLKQEVISYAETGARPHSAQKLLKRIAELKSNGTIRTAGADACDDDVDTQSQKADQRHRA